MYVSVRRYEVDPGSVDEIMRRVEEGFVPIVSKAPGFISYYATAQGGIVCSVSVFESQQAVEKSNRLAVEWVKTIAHLLPKPPQVTAGEARVVAVP